MRELALQDPGTAACLGMLKQNMEYVPIFVCRMFEVVDGAILVHKFRLI